jgi:hypothetical protein
MIILVEVFFCLHVCVAYMCFHQTSLPSSRMRRAPDVHKKKRFSVISESNFFVFFVLEVYFLNRKKYLVIFAVLTFLYLQEECW